MNILSIPRELLFGSFTVDTNLLFLVLGLVFWLFLLWYESKKDGFDDMRIFDMAFLSLVLGFGSLWLFTYQYNYLRIFYPNSYVTGLFSTPLIFVSSFVLSLVPALYGSRKLKWSVYRILDIYSISYAGLAVFVSAGIYLTWGYVYLVYTFVVSIVYLVVAPKIRVRRFFSGGTFSVFLALLGVLCAYAFEDDSRRFTSAFILATISLVNLYFVLKKGMVLRNIADDILNTIKKALLAKKKDLKTEQDLLIQEDPYKREGRDVDSPEQVEEAVMEDAKKEEVDMLLGDITNSQKDVDAALKAIKDGKYGVCSKCSKAIDVARLKALPDTTLCYECSEKLES